MGLLFKKPEISQIFTNLINENNKNIEKLLQEKYTINSEK